MLRNVAANTGHWLGLRLQSSNGDVIGATAYVTTGSVRQRQDVVSGAVYCSQNDMTLHFGLGAATKIDKLEIKWPDGKVEEFIGSGVDTVLTLSQGKGQR